MTVTLARPAITQAETAELVACLMTAYGPQFLRLDGRHALSALLAMEPLTVHAAIALTLLDDTDRAIALSLAGHWALPENVAGQVVQFAMAALPEAMATAEAAMAYARQRQDDVRDDQTGSACHALLAVIDAIDRNLLAGRRMVGAGAPGTRATSKDKPALAAMPVGQAGLEPTIDRS